LAGAMPGALRGSHVSEGDNPTFSRGTVRFDTPTEAAASDANSSDSDSDGNFSPSKTTQLWNTLEKALEDQVEPTSRPAVAKQSPLANEAAQEEDDAFFASGFFASIARNFEDIGKCFSRKEVGFFEGDEETVSARLTRRSVFRSAQPLGTTGVTHVPSRQSRRSSTASRSAAFASSTADFASTSSTFAVTKAASGFASASSTFAVTKAAEDLRLAPTAEDSGDEANILKPHVVTIHSKWTSRHLSANNPGMANMMSIASNANSMCDRPSHDSVQTTASIRLGYEKDWGSVEPLAFSRDDRDGFPMSGRASLKRLSVGGTGIGGDLSVDPKERIKQQLKVFHDLVDDLPESNRRSVLEQFTRQELQISHLQGVIKVYEEMMHGHASAEEAELREPTEPTGGNFTPLE